MHRRAHWCFCPTAGDPWGCSVCKRLRYTKQVGGSSWVCQWPNVIARRKYWKSVTDVWPYTPVVLKMCSTQRCHEGVTSMQGEVILVIESINNLKSGDCIFGMFTLMSSFLRGIKNGLLSFHASHFTYEKWGKSLYASLEGFGNCSSQGVDRGRSQISAYQPKS